MLRGLWKLTWLEIKIFVREPLGVIGTVLIPVGAFIVLGRMLGPRVGASARAQAVVNTEIPVFVAILISLSAVLSLVTIISIYREGGILRRLRATPLRPITILSAHVIVKLLLTAVTFALMVAAGRRYYPADVDAPIIAFSVALLIATFSILSIGFVIASLIPTARFAQPIGSLILYPMVAVSGLFVPIDALPRSIQAVARISPLTFAVSLLKGIWQGDGWMAHLGDLAALAVVFLVCSAVASRVFRWE
jgi:ABC-2 type transport system permease protein